MSEQVFRIDIINTSATTMKTITDTA
jgi:hypothetical protein